MACAITLAWYKKLILFSNSNPIAQTIYDIDNKYNEKLFGGLNNITFIDTCLVFVQHRYDSQHYKCPN